MFPNNPFVTSADDQFVVGESDLQFFGNHINRPDNAVILLCTAGHAQITINQYSGEIRKDTTILLLPNWLLLLTDCSSDFKVLFCSFSKELFYEAACRIEPAFFQALNVHPVSHLPPRMAEGAYIWFQMVEFTYRDRENMFRNTIIRNRLQNVLLEVYDKMQRYSAQMHQPITNTTRQVELFRRFVWLVQSQCSENREVVYYADKLCMSTRYLTTIVRNVAHTTAKSFIDQAVVIEIKMLLQSSELSVQEIAYRLHFPDQSYLGRFFKKLTGLSPTEFRNKKNN